MARVRASRMSNVDAAWLGMDAPQNLMMITAVLWFAGPADHDRLRRVVAARMLERYPKFSQRPVPSVNPLEQPVWADDPAFDLDDHIERLELAAPGGETELAALVGRLLSRPLDMRHSPWQFHVVDGCEGRSVIIARLHHCLADGIALASVLLSLTDDSPDPPAGQASRESDPGSGRRSARRPGLVRRVGTGAAEVLDPAGLATSWPLLRPAQAWRALRFGVDVVRTVVRVLTFTRDPRTRLHGRLGVAKRAAWTRPQDLEEIKAVARVTGATVNDVLMAAVSGALRRYLLAHGDRVHDLRVFVPVNLRPPGQAVPAELGNRFGLVFLRLPVALSGSLARVQAVHEEMRALKGSTQASAIFAVLSLLGALPAWVHGLGIRVLGSKSTAVVTNVPGPKQRVFLAGTPLERIVFWVPSAGSIGLGVSIFSYAGTITVGVAADAGLVADPRLLAAAVEDELDELRASTTRRHGTSSGPDQAAGSGDG